MTGSVPLVPRCNIDDLLLAIQAPPPESATPPVSGSDPPVSRSGQRSKSASVGSGPLVKCPPLPPIQSSRLHTDTDDAAAAVGGDEKKPRARPSSAHVTGSSQSSVQQPRDALPAESFFFMTEVLMFHISLRY